MEQSDLNECKRADDNNPMLFKVRDKVNVGVIRNRKIEDEINVVDDFVNNVIINNIINERLNNEKENSNDE